MIGSNGTYAGKMHQFPAARMKKIVEIIMLLKIA